ncbi:transposase, partial [Aquimarina intermedia]|uniref:transposase n=1 Tax=Aquimarina intermedia TaxID=350814 RepID=UPI001479193F
IKHSKDFKFKAVQKVLRNNLSITAVSDELVLNKSDLKKWIKYYQKYGMSGLTPRSTNTNYSGSLKLKVIRSIERNGLSFREVSLKYNIPSHSTVQSWYLIYQDKGAIGLYKDGRGRSNSMNKRKSKKSSKKPLTREEELLQENESLRAELALLKKLHALAQAKKKK